MTEQSSTLKMVELMSNVTRDAIVRAARENPSMSITDITTSVSIACVMVGARITAASIGMSEEEYKTLVHAALLPLQEVCLNHLKREKA